MITLQLHGYSILFGWALGVLSTIIIIGVFGMMATRKKMGK